MNYLDLHNEVFKRLREKTINSSDVGSNPFINIIGSCINDAKDAVENAWNFSSLRGEDDFVMSVGNEIVTLDGSADSNYLYSRVLVVEQGHFLDPRSEAWMSDAYKDDANSPIPNNIPSYFAPYFNAANGDLQLRTYVRPDTAYTLRVTRSQHQPNLEAFDDILLVPSLPVYSLATALAARERGEVGGTPVNELFAIADAHLSDAVAVDASRYPEETIWFVASNMEETNNRYNY